MKHHVMTTIAAIGLFVTLAAGSAYAQSADTMKVTIPFDFAVSGKTFPAGEYVLRRSIEGPRIVLAIRGEDNNEAAYLATHSIEARDIQQESKLVFNKYGDQSFLSQVWTSGRSYGDELTKTRRERTLARELASKARRPDTFAVIGRKQ